MRAEMLQALLHPEQVRMRSGDDPDSCPPVSLTARQNGAAVPVQADERRDTDRQHHLMGAGRPTSAATRS